MSEFVRNTYPPYNYVLNAGDYVVSYNPKAYDTREPETALIKDGKYLIIEGDHRKQYGSFKTFKECLDYFNKLGHTKVWSSDSWE